MFFLKFCILLCVNKGTNKYLFKSNQKWYPETNGSGIHWKLFYFQSADNEWIAVGCQNHSEMMDPTSNTLVKYSFMYLG